MKKTYIQPTMRAIVLCTAEMLASSTKDGIAIGDQEVEDQGTRRQSIWESDDWKNAINK